MRRPCWFRAIIICTIISQIRIIFLITVLLTDRSLPERQAEEAGRSGCAPGCFVYSTDC